jgi:6-phospho-3-hexuloisomerase
MSVMDNVSDGYLMLCELIESIEQFPSTRIFSNFKKSVKECRRRICVGTGRSGDVADLMVKFLRNIGYKETYGPTDIPYVFKKSDLLIAFSGSGTTTYTLETARIAREAEAKIISITSKPEAPLGILSNMIVMIPGKTEFGHSEDYHGRQLLGVAHSPLTPLGTLFELRSLILTLSLVDSFKHGNVRSSYNELCMLLRGYLPSEDRFSQLYKLLPSPKLERNSSEGKIVVIGEGFSGVVGKFFVTRLRHCAKESEERECYFFTDKGSISVKQGDMTLFISGSGENIPALLSEKAKKKGASVAAITSNPHSTLAENADVTIVIPGREVEKIRGLRSSYLPRDPRKSIFELRTLLSLESFIHFLAEKDDVSEADMRIKHSDFT